LKRPDDPSSRSNGVRARVWARRLSSWTRLRAKDKLGLLKLAAWASLAEVAVRATSLPKLTRRLGIRLDEIDVAGSPPASPPGPAALDRATIDRRAVAVDRLYRAWPRRHSCLRRAVVLGFYVRKAHPILRIGVAREGDDVRAHAWIEVDGRVLGNETGEFAPLRPPLQHTG
jgi:hypothetical protein